MYSATLPTAEGGAVHSSRLIVTRAALRKPWPNMHVAAGVDPVMLPHTTSVVPPFTGPCCGWTVRTVAFSNTKSAPPAQSSPCADDTWTSTWPSAWAGEMHSIVDWSIRVANDSCRPKCTVKDSPSKWAPPTKSRAPPMMAPRDGSTDFTVQAAVYLKSRFVSCVIPRVGVSICSSTRPGGRGGDTHVA